MLEYWLKIGANDLFTPHTVTRLARYRLYLCYQSGSRLFPLLPITSSCVSQIPPLFTALPSLKLTQTLERAPNLVLIPASVRPIKSKHRTCHSHWLLQRTAPPRACIEKLLLLLLLTTQKWDSRKHSFRAICIKKLIRRIQKGPVRSLKTTLYKGGPVYYSYQETLLKNTAFFFVLWFDNILTQVHGANKWLVNVICCFVLQVWLIIIGKRDWSFFPDVCCKAPEVRGYF